MPAQLFLRDFPDVLPACQHLPLRHIMETEQKLCNSRFPASGSSYYRCRLPSLTGKTKIFQCIFICIRKAERHIEESGGHCVFSMKAFCQSVFLFPSVYLTIQDSRLLFQHFADSPDTHSGSWEQDDHHLGHDDIE